MILSLVVWRGEILLALVIVAVVAFWAGFTLGYRAGKTYRTLRVK